MQLRCFTRAALDMLVKDVSTNLPKYDGQESWLDEYFQENDYGQYCFDSGIEIETINLILGGPENDFENSRMLFESLKDRLKMLDATDMRLWTYLAHANFWDYMVSRWSLANTQSRDSPVERVKKRYLDKESISKRYTRHGIARLYWNAYLTYDEENADPYEGMKFLYNQQDNVVNLTERSFSHNKMLMKIILRTLMKDEDVYNEAEYKREAVRDFSIRLNEAGSITVLDSLNQEQAEELCNRLSNETKAKFANA
ncbi:DUF6339 family protein [Alloscardovia omnicolens]|uniref:Uncharacterized protein n=2 Tax=Bacillati TaxID=1783272 RepID=U1RC50_9BIFI|nr:DUF6339 family protein [Alloscardovia omnicolens]ERH31169.1 hypothetical protein HMPREF9244_00611 [Alloscardovia omnicolens F0580]MDK6445018.1 DUF6339 family protein [Alloscardovia omnicolens]PKY78325.1 hypothetical protein CYJ33_06305 [Alloscardovia omnicolens]